MAKASLSSFVGHVPSWKREFGHSVAPVYFTLTGTRSSWIAALGTLQPLKICPGMWCLGVLFCPLFAGLSGQVKKWLFKPVLNWSQGRGHSKFWALYFCLVLLLIVFGFCWLLMMMILFQASAVFIAFNCFQLIVLPLLLLGSAPLHFFLLTFCFVIVCWSVSNVLVGTRKAELDILINTLKHKL